MYCGISSCSFHFVTFVVPSSHFIFTTIYSWGRAVPLNLNAKSKAWVKEGNFCTSCKLSKGKSHPVFIFGGVANMFPIVWGFWGLASFCLMLCRIHCLDHAGCQGCC